MDKVKALQQDLLIAKSVGLGLTAVLSVLFYEHAKRMGGGDAAVAETRALADKSLRVLSASGTTPSGGTIDPGLDMRKLTVLIDEAENYARRGPIRDQRP